MIGCLAEQTGWSLGSAAVICVSVFLQPGGSDGKEKEPIRISRAYLAQIDLLLPDFQGDGRHLTIKVQKWSGHWGKFRKWYPGQLLAIPSF